MIRVERGFPGKDRPKAALMFWDAFEDKLGFCMKPKAKALRFLSDQIRSPFSFSACEGDTLLGLVGFKDEDGGFVGGTYRDIAAIYGNVSAIWRGAILSRFERELESGQLLLDGLFVVEDARGQGIGTALLEALEGYARYELYKEIRLDVVDTNVRAKALYERCGYVAVGVVKTGFLKRVLGFSSATTMVKIL